MKHPNAAASGLTGAGVTVLLYFSDLFGLAMPPYVAGAIVTLAAAAVLFFGPKK